MQNIVNRNPWSYWTCDDVYQLMKPFTLTSRGANVENVHTVFGAAFVINSLENRM